MSKYITINTVCKCGHTKRSHVISGNRPTKKKPLYASCGRGAYPSYIRYKGKCLFCKCNKFTLSIESKDKQGCGKWFKSFEQGRVGMDTQCGYQYRKNTRRHLCPECKTKDKQGGRNRSWKIKKK